VWQEAAVGVPRSLRSGLTGNGVARNQEITHNRQRRCPVRRLFPAASKLPYLEDRVYR